MKTKPHCHVPSGIRKLIHFAILSLLGTVHATAQTLPVIPTEFFQFPPPDYVTDFGSYSVAFTTNLITTWVDIPDFGGYVLILDTTNITKSYLEYYVSDSNYNQNIEYDTGESVLFFEPNWSSQSRGGTGPGETGYFIWGGDTTNGLFRVYADSAGSNIFFGGVKSGVTNTYASAPISWTSNSWHEIGVQYSVHPSQSKIYLDGALAATGSAVSDLPVLGYDTNGFCTNTFFIGSDDTGFQQMRGAIWNMDTWAGVNYKGYYTNGWINLSNQLATWQASLGGGGGFGMMMGGIFFTPTYTPDPATNYVNYTNFWLTASPTATNGKVQVTIHNTLSNLTYVILTNQTLTNSVTNWGVWQVLLATNAITPAPIFTAASNSMFFSPELVLIIGTNQIADYWQMLYFKQLGINPYADPDGDGLCNYSEYLLGTNPTNANSISSTRKDAQALFLAYTNDATTRMRLFQTNGPGSTNVTLTLSNTFVGTNYQIYSKDLTTTNSAWRVETNFVGTNTTTQITIALAGRTLGFIGGDGTDSDGDGLPNGYEVLATLTDPMIPDTGQTGTPDGYKDPDGDGHSNLEEYYNGTDPHVFNTPVGVPNISLDFATGTSGNVLATWQPAAGAVIGYIIAESSDGYYYTNVATNSASQLSFLNTASIASSAYISVQAVYSNGLASIGYADPLAESSSYVRAPVAFVSGPGGLHYLVTPQIPGGLAEVEVALGASGGASYNTAVYPISSLNRYGLPQTLYPSATSNINFTVAASRFTNGIAQLTTNEVPPFMQFCYVNAAVVDTKGGSVTYEFVNGDPYAIPFMDASTQMKQNLAFQLRVADVGPLQYEIETTNGDFFFAYPSSYVYSDYFYTDNYSYGQYLLLWNQFEPIEDNYFFRNLVFATNQIGAGGYLNTDFIPESPGAYYDEYQSLTFNFPTSDYILHSNMNLVPGVLSAATTAYVGEHGESDIGDFYYGSTLASNIFGLAYNSLYTDTNAFYVGTVQPSLQTVAYYFARADVDPTPGCLDGSFTTTNTTPALILGSVGQQMAIAGYAKQAILNGYNNVFAYLGQYFTNALLMTNGVLTTNSAILSPYGFFFPIVPGHVGMLTMPDPSQTNIQGTCQIDIIRLSLDVNHDGVMDETFTGPDNTFPENPFVFWVNNDYDRTSYDADDNTNYEDSVQVAGCPYTPTLNTPDCSYLDASGHRAIPTKRDLEDYARLWVSGVSNTLSRLPVGSTVTLSWAGMGTSPTIDLFQAADTDGGIGYLTNVTTASNQINTNLCRYVGRLGAYGSIQLNASTFTNTWAGDNYIWCGVSSGNDQLVLTIADGSGNVLAQSSQWIQILDIKQMYERWTVGDAPNSSPLTNVYPAADNFSPGQPTTAFTYSYDPAIDTNDNYVLLIHGWNMYPWEKDRWAERAYKRLYWQGYHGRFGEFRWPTDYGFQGTLSQLFSSPTEKDNFDRSEYQSWQSAAALSSKLADLNAHYPGHVFALAHSMGNVVTSEAIRLSGSTQLVNTYVASQGAVSAQTYGTNIANYSFYYPPWSLVAETPNIYGNWFSTNNGGGAGRVVNFYNTNDFALSRGHWQLDQMFKPDQAVAEATGTWYYSDYDGASDPPPWTNFYKQTFTGSTFIHFNLTNLNNRYEVMPFAAQSYTTALGATPGVGHVAANVNLMTLWPTPDPLGNNYASHFYHSAEFRGDGAWQWNYWHTLLFSPTTGFNITNP